jgi:hypothetical protein
VKGQAHDTPNFLPVRPSYASGIHLDGYRGNHALLTSVGPPPRSSTMSTPVCDRACSVYKAASQPGPANYESISVGVPRMQVITTLGAPKFSDVDPQGHKLDAFEFQSAFIKLRKRASCLI